ncbi:MAG: FliM/FliN family flagellar motor switch protein [Parvularculaceae bacterium]
MTELIADTFRARACAPMVAATRQRLEEFRAEYPDWTHFHLSDGETEALVAVPAALVLAAADTALGLPTDRNGAGQPTALDRRLAGVFAARLATVCLRQFFLAGGASNGPELKVRSFDAHSEGPPLDRTFAHLTSVTIEGAFLGGDEQVRAVVATPDAGGEVATPAGENEDAHWRAHMHASAGNARIDVRGILSRANVGAYVLLTLKQGDVIPLPEASIEALHLAAGGAALAQGRLGDYRKRRAVQLTSA